MTLKIISVSADHKLISAADKNHSTVSSGLS